MSDAVIVAAAKAVHDAIQAKTNWGIEFDLERSYFDWELELKDATPLRVDVIPLKHETSDKASRGRLRYVVSINIAVRKRFSEAEQTEGGRIEKEQVDTLVKFVEDIHEFFASNERPSDTDDMAWNESKIENAYSAKELREWHQFIGLVRINLTVMKANP
jgi:hypothetical protein